MMNYLILINVPVGGQGYREIYHLDGIDSEGQEKINPGTKDKINQITNRLSEPVQELFRSYNTDHFQFNVFAEANDLFSVFASYINKRTLDEQGRNGIVHGVYFQKCVENFDLSATSQDIYNYFLHINQKHQALCKNAQLDNAPVDSLIEEFVGDAKEILSKVDILNGKVDSKDNPDSHTEIADKEFVGDAKEILSKVDIPNDKVDSKDNPDSHTEIANNEELSSVDYVKLLKDNEEFKTIVRETVKDEIERYIQENDRSVLIRILKKVFCKNMDLA
ncbi:MAG: hypothetical protein LGR52_09355 [Candidatus Thiosymbion ectosymbiont of Robbea hypermnestra]|nr:hypothetical protein [Candidatus Thiosymbion ectosymbiont of Robbea hypermnestra]